MRKKEVLLANKEFYDKTADIYDLADGRRSDKLERWLENKLKKLAQQYGNNNFLDLGCGTGFVMKCAKNYFEKVVGVDISEAVLKKAQKFGKVVCADIAHLPFKKEKFNVVVCFATLHHCFDTKMVFEESYRVLKKGGCFYSDHDLEKNFVKNFHLLLSFYRILRNPVGRYTKLVKGVDKSLYEKSEYHSKGLDAKKIKKELSKVGFAKINLSYHWFGLSPGTDWIFGQKNFRLGWAPLLSIEAKKNTSEVKKAK